MAAKLDIFDTLAAIDKRDFDFLDRQTDELKKAFTPLIVMRWASAARDGDDADLMLMLVNTYANPNFFDIADHPELQYKLMTSAGLGAKLRHEWIAMPKRKASASKVHEFLQRWWPEANEHELNILLKQFTRESFRAFIDDCALPPDETSEIVNAYDRLYGYATEPAKKKAKGKAGAR